MPMVNSSQKMWVEIQDKLNTSMLNISDSANDKVKEMAQIPKRVPIDSVEWQRILDKFNLSGNDALKYASETHQGADFTFYFVTSILTLIVLGFIILVYTMCCIWVLKGNLDLPLPGGGTQPKIEVKLRNPVKVLRTTLSRYSKEKKESPESHQQPPPRRQQPNTSNTFNPIESGGAGEASGAAGPTPNNITTISHSQAGPSSVVTDNASKKSRTMLFDKRNLGICDSFRQFQQFQYDLQDEDQEEVVFDVYDLQK